jgi:hypothetical protein
MAGTKETGANAASGANTGTANPAAAANKVEGASNAPVVDPGANPVIPPAAPEAAPVATVAEVPEVPAKVNESIRDLCDKGEGILTRFGHVWSYPGAKMDPSGTNLRLPIENVSDAEVTEALANGQLVAATIEPGGFLRAVRLVVEGADPIPLLLTSQAGTADAGTELPAGSRPSQDAGATTPTPNEAAETTAANLRTLQGDPPERRCWGQGR